VWKPPLGRKLPGRGARLHEQPWSSPLSRSLGGPSDRGPLTSAFRARRFWIGSCISVALLGILLWRTNTGAIWRIWRSADAAVLVAAAVLYIISVWVRSYRYRLILLSNISLSSWQLFPIIAIGYMANSLLPARAGELVRTYALGELHMVSKMFSLGTLAVEHVADGITLLGILVLAEMLLGVNGALRTLGLLTAPVFAVALAVVVAAVALPNPSERMAARMVSPLPDRLRDSAERFVSAFVAGLGSLRHVPLLAGVLGTSVIAWGMEGAVYALVGMSLGIHIGFGYYLLAAAAANLALTAPSSQGGIGPFEFFAAQALIAAGMGNSAAVAFALATHAVVILPVSVLGLIFVWWIGRVPFSSERDKWHSAI